MSPTPSAMAKRCSPRTCNVWANTLGSVSTATRFLRLVPFLPTTAASMKEVHIPSGRPVRSRVRVFSICGAAATGDRRPSHQRSADTEGVLSVGAALVSVRRLLLKLRLTRGWRLTLPPAWQQRWLAPISSLPDCSAEACHSLASASSPRWKGRRRRGWSTVDAD